MPISEKQQAASRANGAKSRGPVSIAGKRNSARNSTRHGLLSNTVLVENESPERFAALLNSFHAEFQPTDATETLLVEKMAVCHWRLLRTWALESAAFNHETRRQATATVDEDPPTRTMLALRAIGEQERHPDTIGRYERRYHREYYAALETLDRRRERKNAARTWQIAENKQPALAVEPGKHPLEPGLKAIEPEI